MYICSCGVMRYFNKHNSGPLCMELLRAIKMAKSVKYYYKLSFVLSNKTEHFKYMLFPWLTGLMSIHAHDIVKTWEWLGDDAMHVHV